MTLITNIYIDVSLIYFFNFMKFLRVINEKKNLVYGHPSYQFVSIMVINVYSGKDLSF